MTRAAWVLSAVRIPLSSSRNRSAGDSPADASGWDGSPVHEDVYIASAGPDTRNQGCIGRSKRRVELFCRLGWRLCSGARAVPRRGRWALRFLRDPLAVRRDPVPEPAVQALGLSGRGPGGRVGDVAV